MSAERSPYAKSRVGQGPCPEGHVVLGRAWWALELQTLIGRLARCRLFNFLHLWFAHEVVL